MSPLFIEADNGHNLICMTVEYYERMTGQKLERESLFAYIRELDNLDENIENR